MQTPVAFMIFRRPELTARVFTEIAHARPPVLLVVADGPKSTADRVDCAATRAVIESVDWPCDVRRCYSETNLGCRARVASGLDWVFGQVQEAIILEDDTVPHPDFFRFCDDLLARYRHDPRVGHLGGTDHNRGAPRGDGSYYASRYTSIWGWATWRRCWLDYDVNMACWPEVRAAGTYHQWFATRAEADHMADVWDDIYAKRIDTWDAQWLFCRLLKGSLSLVPNGNLITNVGFHAEATHTRDTTHPFAKLATCSMAFPLRQPSRMRADDDADRLRAEAEFLRRLPLAHRVRQKLSNRHWYGAWLRRVPVIGRAWAQWRAHQARPQPFNAKNSEKKRYASR